MPLTADMRRQIDQIRDYLFGGGYPNPMANAEQLSFLFFFYLIEGIDAENAARAKVLKQKYESLFAGEWELKNPLNALEKGQTKIPKERFRWSVWARGLSGESLVRFVQDEVFPFFETVAARSATNFMRGARLSITEPTVLTQVVTLVDGLRLDQEDSDTKGDLFEHVLKQIKQAGELGQFRTPRHIIRAIVEMIDPQIGESIYDPAAGTAGFLVAAYNRIRLANSSPAGITDVEIDGKVQRRGVGDKLSSAQTTTLQNKTFYGNDVDPQMVRLATMNLTLRGLPNVRILLRNVLTTILDLEQREALQLPEEGYHVVLANPPFAGKIDNDRVVDDVKVGNSKATELLFLKYMMESLRTGGRCGVIVPDGVVRGTSASHLELRRQLLEGFCVEGVIALPHFAFKPYASVATYILLFRRAPPESHVWVYQIAEDGYSADSLREPVTTDDLPDLLRQWQARKSASYRPVPGKHGWVSLERVRGNEFSLIPRLLLNERNELHRYPLVRLGDVCTIVKGKSSAASAPNGNYPLVTTARLFRRTDHFDFEGNAICVPLVSSTGHGHASINNIHYVTGSFAAATIVAVIQAKPLAEINLPYVFRYLSTFREEVLVALMQGATNVSLSIEKITNIRIPVPPSVQEQHGLVSEIENVAAKISELTESLAALRADMEEELTRFEGEFKSVQTDEQQEMIAGPDP